MNWNSAYEPGWTCIVQVICTIRSFFTLHGELQPGHGLDAPDGDAVGNLQDGLARDGAALGRHADGVDLVAAQGGLSRRDGDVRLGDAGQQAEREARTLATMRMSDLLDTFR